ncbi:MAG: hypothetical protein FJ091_15450 [Deltaproteobacteria bacterium]|nr:hypothetical protein [Deltaproteobacteria bacterium]
MLVIRACAAFDLVVTGLFALPFSAKIFVATLYALDRALGGNLATPQLSELGAFFTNLAGMLGVLWAAVRLARPERFLARADAMGRVAVAALIAWYLATESLPDVMWAFVATELGGAAAQWWVTRR